MLCCSYCKKNDNLREPLQNLYCFNCGKYFNSVEELKDHQKKYHKKNKQII